MPDEERSIRDLVRTWMAATKKGDLAIVLGLMAEDVIFMVPGEQPFGKAAFAETFEQIKKMKIDIDSEILEIKISGNWAYLRTRLKVTMQSPGKEGQSRSGHTLSILRKETDGRWVIARDANLLSKVGHEPC